MGIETPYLDAHGYVKEAIDYFEEALEVMAAERSDKPDAPDLKEILDDGFQLFGNAVTILGEIAYDKVQVGEDVVVIPASGDDPGGSYKVPRYETRPADPQAIAALEVLEPLLFNPPEEWIVSLISGEPVLQELISKLKDFLSKIDGEAKSDKKYLDSQPDEDASGY